MHEDILEVLTHLLHTVSQVDVATDFRLVLAILLLASNEENSGHTAVSQKLLTFCQLLKEFVTLNRATLMGERLNASHSHVLLSVLVSLLFGGKLLAGEDLALTVEADFDELTSKLIVFQIEEIFLLHLIVQVLFVSFKSFKAVINLIVVTILHH